VWIRAVSALLLGAAALAATVQGGYAYLVMVFLCSALVHREWHRATRAPAPPVAFAGLPFIWAAAAMAFFGEFGLSAAFCAGAVAALASLALARGDSAVWAAAGAVYVLLPSIALVLLRDLSLELVLFLFAVVWVTDMGAYLFGSQIGGPKLWPRVSPRKTWSGAVGGAVAGAAAGAALWTALLGGAPAAGFALALLLSISGQAGDLAESAWKRHFNVKDSGGIIPGHGGVMDRLDSLIAASVVLAALAALGGEFA
jgi:phosphatidate cytidylyltransferase